MRIKPHYLFVPLALLLSGCDKDFATLEFESRVQNNAYRVDVSAANIMSVYRLQLSDVLRKQGIDPEQVDMRLGESGGSTIVFSTSMFKELEEARKAALHDALKAIVDGREQAIGVTFTLRPEDMEAGSAGVREQAVALPREYTTGLGVKDVLIGVSYGLTDVLNSALAGSRQTDSEAFCSVSMTVEPQLPFYDLRLFEREGKPAEAMLTKNLYTPYSRDHIPVDIAVDIPELQAALASGDMEMSTQLTGDTAGGRVRNKRGISQLEILIGPLGQVSHEQAKVEYFSHTHLESKCREMAAALGRPFTYKMGDSLDRLRSVSVY
ncbi:MAG: hypothetical protein ACN6O6_19280 [Pseudomonas sp.]|uniref:hypothetical protein n=1 Tax=Pseudomonas sp. TaxID=306 RepID=UPI003D11781A